MEPATPPTHNAKIMRWVGYVVSALPVLFLILSAVMKFVKPVDVVKGFEQLGWPVKLAEPLAIIEIASTILYVIPQTAVLGAILLTGYLGGAVATHVRIGDNFAMPAIMGVLLWLGLFLRDPRVRALVPLRW